MVIDDMSLAIRDPFNTILVGRKSDCRSRGMISGAGGRMRTIILILGVHRSGTSPLLTHGLAAAGASPGTFDDIRDANNPDGYAEHPKVRHFNDRLLAHLGASWDNWGFGPARSISIPPRLHHGGRRPPRSCATSRRPRPIRAQRSAHRHACALLEGVVAQAGFALRRILIIREPSEVGESQRQRVERPPSAHPSLPTSSRCAPSGR